MISTANFDEIWISMDNSNAYFILPFVLLASVPFIRWLCKPHLNEPKGPTGLPIVGYLPFLGQEPYKTLHTLKKKYGNVFSLHLGLTKVIILADYPAVEEAFSKPKTSYRPPGIFDFLPDGFGFASDNGPKWMEHRRFVLRTMRNLGLGKTTWTSLLEEELSDFLDVIASKNGHPVDVEKLLTPSIANNVCSLIFGKRFPGSVLDSFNSASQAITEFFTQSGLWNFFPTLCNILTKLKIGRYYEIHEKMVTFNKMIRSEIEQHKKSQNEIKGSDFIYEYLDVLQDKSSKEKGAHFNEGDLTGDAQVLFIGGSDTTRATLTWLFLAMATYPDYQENVYAELESLLGNQQMALWEDRMKFPYTYAVILEGQRWKSVVPLNTSRMAAEDIQIGGYDIKKGSPIIANNWGLHNDPRYWRDPENFVPERFLLNEGKEVNLKAPSYVPFSYGKRKCPGESVAMMEIFLYFTAVMQKFRVQTPDGGKPNLDGILGLVYLPVPQKLCFVARK